MRSLFSPSNTTISIVSRDKPTSIGSFEVFCIIMSLSRSCPLTSSPLNITGNDFVIHFPNYSHSTESGYWTTKATRQPDRTSLLHNSVVSFRSQTRQEGARRASHHVTFRTCNAGHHIFDQPPESFEPPFSLPLSIQISPPFRSLDLILALQAEPGATEADCVTSRCHCGDPFDRSKESGLYSLPGIDLVQPTT